MARSALLERSQGVLPEDVKWLVVLCSSDHKAFCQKMSGELVAVGGLGDYILDAFWTLVWYALR